MCSYNFVMTSQHGQPGPVSKANRRVWWAVRPLLVVLGICVTVVGFGQCEKKPMPPGGAGERIAGPLRVVVTIPPVRGIIEPLLSAAGAKYELLTLLPPGASEHGFEITPASMEALGKADVVVMIGLGMEPQVEKFLAEHANASRRVVVLSEAVKTELVESADGHDDHAGHDHQDHAGHDHGAHDHHHHGADPHIWLDPVLVREIVGDIAAAIKPLASLASVDAGKLDEARAVVQGRVDQVHSDYQRALASAPRRTIVVAHDAYGYLARRYTLEVISITGLSAGEPQPGDVQRAAAAVVEKKLTTIFVEPQLSPAAAQRLAGATGAKTAVLDPLGDGDWFGLMGKNLAALKDALGVPVAPAVPSAAPVDTKH